MATTDDRIEIVTKYVNATNGNKDFPLIENHSHKETRGDKMAAKSKVKANLTPTTKKAEKQRTNTEITSHTKLLGHDRRSGAMSVTGQLYETKLLTLILLRFINNRDSVEFYLGANISGAGALDDLCFKYKPPNSVRQVIVFLQAKHKVDPDKGKITMKLIKKNDSDFSVQNHFESYLMIRQKFTPKSNDIIFKGAYHDSLCYFVVYTPLKHDVGSTKRLEQNDTNSDVKDLIQTNRSGDIFQLDYKDVDFLYKNLQEKHMQQLGKMFLELILNRNRSVNMMDDGIIKTYHVVLAQNVIEVIDTDVEGVRKGKFRSEFFENKEKLMTIFRDTIFEEAVSNKALNPTDNDVTLLKYVGDSPSVVNISKVIGNVLCYNQKTNLLEFLDEQSKDRNAFEFLKQMKVEPSTVKNAVNVKGQEILQHFEFNLPAGFGNRDLTLKGNAKKIEKRLDFLAVRMARLFESAECSNGLKFVDVHEGLVGPDGVVERGVVEHNGGLGSALGNLLVLDRDTDALKFNSSEPLPGLANKLWNILKAYHDEEVLTTYRFKFRIDNFPKAYLEEYWYEEYLVKDFIGQYWLCTGQAKEDAVESIAKKEVNKYVKAQAGNQPTFCANTDAIFLMLHDLMQKWWMLPDKAEYLTENSKYLQRAMAEIVDNPLLSVLNVICLMKLKSSAIEFDEAAVKSLVLDEASCNLTLVVTDSVTHTAVKLMQHYTHSQNCTFIDFSYVTNLMFCNLQDLAKEVRNCNMSTLIITCNVAGELEVIADVLDQFILDLEKKNIILVVDLNFSRILKQELTCSYHEVNDNKNSLNDLSSESQERILNESKIVFQGKEVSLKTIVESDSKHLITSQTLQKLVNKVTIDIGKPLVLSTYNKIKDFYVDRNVVISSKYADVNNLTREEQEPVTIVVKTLYDLFQDVVVVTAPPGMGKSTLLTHLSLETKKMYPDVWIARINLLSHSKQFHQWQKDNISVGIVEALAFLCKAVSCGETNYEVVNTDHGLALKRDNRSAEELVQAELFVNSYKNGKAIVIFDGVDEICPLYEKEVIQLIKITANAMTCENIIKKPKLWIASRSYNNVKHVIEREFGASYNLEPLSNMEHQIYLFKLWRVNMKLDKFTNEQLLNVNSFIDYMRQFCHIPGGRINPSFKPIVVALYELYFVAVKYFQNEIRHMPLTPEKEGFKKNWNLDFEYPNQNFRRNSGDLNSLSHISGSPLHTHIAAEFFESQIKYNLTNDTNKWDLEHNTFYIYEHYLETKLLKIRFEEKNQIDIYNPDNISMHEKERKEFLDMHRKLAFYSIFHENSNVLMSERKLGDVRSMLDKIKYATEKTGVIDCIVDGEPRFVHLIFAEYFAVDYICDMLKMAFALKHYDRQELIWRFVLSPLFRERTVGFTNMFDYKFVFDVILKIILDDARTQKIVYETLIKDSSSSDDESKNVGVWSKFETTFFDIQTRGMKYTSVFLLKCIIKYIRFRNDVDKFVLFICSKKFFSLTLDQGYVDGLCLALDFLREINSTALDTALQNNGINYGSRLAAISNEQMLSDLWKHHLSSKNI